MRKNDDCVIDYACENGCVKIENVKHGDFKLVLTKKSRTWRGTFACANQADRCMNLPHCAQRSTP